MATTLNRIIDHKAAWHLVDAKGQIVGHLANQIAPILRGKHKPTFCPNDDCGDYVVVINAKDIEFTGRKWKQKAYKYHTGWPGGLKERATEWQLQKKPEEILRKAVVGMLPKNDLRRRMAAKLRVYAGSNHPHENELPFETAECLLMDRERKFKDEYVEVEEVDEEMEAEWEDFKQKAYAWQIKTFGHTVGWTDEDYARDAEKEKEGKQRELELSRQRGRRKAQPAKK